MTKTYNPPWETSSAYIQHYAEVRERVADILHAWGSDRNSQWPEDARFIRIGQPQMTPAWFTQIVHLGRAGIGRSIPGWKLQELFPQLSWDQYTHDVYFTEMTQGNVQYTDSNPRQLSAYIQGPDYIRVVELGCDHPNAEQVANGASFRKYHCGDCGYTWGVDSSG